MHARLIFTATWLVLAIAEPVRALDFESVGTFVFDVAEQDGGQCVNGTADSYDGAYFLEVNGTRYDAAGAGAQTTLGGRGVRTAAVGIGSLSVYREIYVPESMGDYVRYLDVVENAGSTSTAVTLALYGDLGSDVATTVYATSDGDRTVDATDTWFGTDDADGSGDSTLAHVLQGDGAPLTATSAARSGETFRWEFGTTLGAHQRIAILSFGIQKTSREAAIDEAATLVELPSSAVEGLDEYVPSIVNFRFFEDGAPRITFTSRALADEGATIDVSATVRDPESDPVTFSWDTDDDGTFDEHEGETSVRLPTGATDGPSSVRVGVRASDGTHVSERYHVIAVQNVAPHIVSSPPLQGREGRPYRYALEVEDPGGAADPLTFTLVEGPPAMSMDASGVVNWVPAADDLAEDSAVTVRVAVEDDDGGGDSESWEVTLSPNAAPAGLEVVWPTPGVALGQGTPRLIVSNALDPDLDLLEYLFQVDTTATFDSTEIVESAPVAEGVAITAWTVVPALAPDQHYFWRAWATDGSGSSEPVNGDFFVVPDPTLGGDGGADADAAHASPAPSRRGGTCALGAGPVSQGKPWIPLLFVLAACLAWTRGLRRMFWLFTCALAAAASGARAQDLPAENATAAVESDLEVEQQQLEAREEAARRSAESPSASESLSHEGQFGLRTGIAFPYLYAIRYSDGPPCSDELGTDGRPQLFCFRPGAPSLDLELSYAPLASFELAGGLKLGLTNDEAAEAAPLAFSVGVRMIGSADSMLKLFFGARAFLDATRAPSSVENWGRLDIGARGEFGLAVDVLRYLGAYVQLAETISVLRGLYFMSELSAGLQLRGP